MFLLFHWNDLRESKQKEQKCAILNSSLCLYYFPVSATRNHYRFSGIQWHISYPTALVRSEVRWVQTLWVFQGWSQGVGRRVCFPGASVSLFTLIAVNFNPLCCETEDFLFWLLVGGVAIDFWSCLNSLTQDPLPLQNQLTEG